jgi:DNA-binding NarL/FixJ family response regulator
LVACYIPRQTTAPDEVLALLILGLNDAEVAGELTLSIWSSARLHMGTSSIRVLVAEDYKPWLRFISSELEKLSNLQPIGEVSDGEEAVQQAQKLQPDLILLDIGLPTINGIEAARRIREVSPASKILFVSETRSPEIAEEALNTGAGGYVLKSDAASDLLPAIKAVLEGKRFVSASLAGHFLVAILATATQTNLLTSMVTLISGIC